MKKLTLAFVATLILALSNLLSAQTILTSTTLAAAVSTTSATTVTVTSATGITANSTVLFVADAGSSGEAMFVNAVNGTQIGVTRGYQTQGKARTHVSGALVFIAPPNALGYVQPSGSCTRANIPYLPDIAVGLEGTATTISDCIGGVWVNATVQNINTFFRVPLPPLGSVAYTGVGTNTAVASATSMYCTELDVPYSKYVTGLAVLNGATVGTDKHLAVLYDGAGNLIANSATAGATTSGASTYQTYAFTTPYYVVGPARYYGCLQSNGTTDTVRMLTTGTLDQYTTKAVTSQVFGTIAASFTVPTTFTTVVGPVWELY